MARRDPTAAPADDEKGAAAPAPPSVESLDAVQRERRARIIDAAITMILTTEYDRIQMRDVTAAAGVALGTTYRYFASKEHLIGEALLVWSEGFPTDVPDAGGSDVERLRRAFRLAVRAFEPHPTVYGAMVVLQASTDPYAAATFQRFAALQTAAFERFLPGVAPERRSAIVMVMGAVLDTQLRNWALGRAPISQVYERIDTAAALVLPG